MPLRENSLKAIYRQAADETYRTAEVFRKGAREGASVSNKDLTCRFFYLKKILRLLQPFERRFIRAANGACVIVGNLCPSRSGGNSRVGVALRLVVRIPAYRTNIFCHNFPSENFF
jgi:hypothetical protein